MSSQKGSWDSSSWIRPNWEHVRVGKGRHEVDVFFGSVKNGDFDDVGLVDRWLPNNCWAAETWPGRRADKEALTFPTASGPFPRDSEPNSHPNRDLLSSWLCSSKRGWSRLA